MFKVRVPFTFAMISAASAAENGSNLTRRRQPERRQATFASGWGSLPHYPEVNDFGRHAVSPDIPFAMGHERTDLGYTGFTGRSFGDTESSPQLLGKMVGSDRKIERSLNDLHMPKKEAEGPTTPYRRDALG
jgi:hypothetical protein